MIFIFTIIFEIYHSFFCCSYIVPSLHFSDKATLSRWIIFLLCVFILFAIILLNIFESMFSRDFDLLFDFCICVTLFVSFVLVQYWLQRRSLGVLFLFLLPLPSLPPFLFSPSPSFPSFLLLFFLYRIRMVDCRDL